MNQMRVALYYNNRDIRIKKIPIPKVGSHDVLIKVRACGICGSDIMEWYRIKKAPLVLGHEVVGEIVELGENIQQYRIGERVFATHHVPCDSCYYCLRDNHTACETFQGKNNFNPGGFSEYLLITGRSVLTGIIKLSDEVSDEQGSFIEPLGTVVRGLRAANVNPGDTMAVFGSGIAGLLMIKMAKTLGAGRLIAIDINENRLETARNFGADYSITPDRDIPEFIRKVNKGRLVDKVIICTGVLKAAEVALRSVERGGTILFFAVPKPGETINLDFNPYWRNDIAIKTSYGAAPLDNFQALELIRSKKVDVCDMITHRLSLEEISIGFDLAVKGESLKIIIKPWGN